MRNAAVGYLLAASGVLTIPLLMVAIWLAMHWIEGLLFGVALVIFAIVTYPRTKPVR